MYKVTEPPVKRVALFAHYDRDCLIDDYVLYYLNGLKAVAEKIIFVSDCELPAEEAGKLDGVAELIFAGRHGEYDFGSWKRGFAHLGGALSEWDEVIIANDSCYAPVFPFEDSFARMATVDCDVWGPTATSNKRGDFDHLNSYFLVFRRPVLSDSAFLSFWPQVTALANVDEVIHRYEIGLSRLLISRGYRVESLTPQTPLTLPLQGVYLRRVLPSYRVSWLKVRMFRDNPFRALGIGRSLSEIDRHYPRRLIDAHIRRLIGSDAPVHYHYRLGTFEWPPVGAARRCFLVRGKVKHGRWWKLYAYVLGIPIFALVLPLRQRHSAG